MAFRRPSWTTIALYIVLSLLMSDSIIEIAYISSTVYFLHNRAGGAYKILYSNQSGRPWFELHGKPKHLWLNQGHLSNGAAGTALVLVGFGGFITLCLLSHHNQKAASRTPRYVAILHHIWLITTLLSVLLTFAALIYTFVVTNQTDNQRIDVPYAASLPNFTYPFQFPYMRSNWTPETWFTAMLKVPLASIIDRSDIEKKLRIMRGWRFNLIPMFLLGVALCVLAVFDAIERRRLMRETRGTEIGKKEMLESTEK